MRKEIFNELKKEIQKSKDLESFDFQRVHLMVDINEYLVMKMNQRLNIELSLF